VKFFSILFIWVFYLAIVRFSLLLLPWEPDVFHWWYIAEIFSLGVLGSLALWFTLETLGER
jgi:hypothetical protein